MKRIIKITLKNYVVVIVSSRKIKCQCVFRMDWIGAAVMVAAAAVASVSEYVCSFEFVVVYRRFWLHFLFNKSVATQIHFLLRRLIILIPNIYYTL